MANENGWGDGASNNNIGWGQGAVNNAISWGAIHSLSAAGLTDIVGQTFQPESVAYFTAIEDAGGTLSDDQKEIINTFLVAERDASRLSKHKVICLTVGGNLASVTINMVNPGTYDLVLYNFVSGDVDSVCGLQGDGSTKYAFIENSFDDIVADPRTDLQYGFFSNGWADEGNNVFPMGSQELTPSSSFYVIRNDSGTVTGYAGSNLLSTGADAIGNTANLTSIICGRYSGTSLYTLTNGNEGSEIVTDVSSSQLPVGDIPIFGREINGGGARNITNADMTIVFISEGLSLSETKAFESNCKTMLTDLFAL